MSRLNEIIIITGPTGSGKTEISIKIAQYIPEIEIISVDSMQIYKGLNIGTAKPNKAILDRYKHHCIDFVDPSTYFDVIKYTQCAKNCIQDILLRNKKPLLTGGTGLYIKSLLKPFFDGPGRDQSIRNRLTKLRGEKGNQFLFDQLRKCDPEYSDKISQNDTKRIIRALEVFYLTGKPFSFFHQKSSQDQPKSTYNYYIICLNMNRKMLYQRINHRVDQMIKDGLIEETQKIIEQKKDISLNSLRGLGYKQIISYLQGNISRENAIEIIKNETRHYAKRQLSWFKNQIKVDCWANLDDYINTEQCVEHIVTIMKGKGY